MKESYYRTKMKQILKMILKITEENSLQNNSALNKPIIYFLKENRDEQRKQSMAGTLDEDQINKCMRKKGRACVRENWIEMCIVIVRIVIVLIYYYIYLL